MNVLVNFKKNMDDTFSNSYSHTAMLKNSFKVCCIMILSIKVLYTIMHVRVANVTAQFPVHAVRYAVT